ncbi:MAG: enoyl-CoA hydratase-related protein [Gemmatimonadota bacterium]|nr:enoyl-CoA hydratase/isomerase family protein [Gemmatimonadota bacterium]
MSELEFVRVERDGAIATVVIDRPEKLNALNPQVIDEIGRAFGGLKDDADVLGVLLRGGGEKAFVAGADIGVLATMDPLTGVDVSRQGQAVFRAIERFPKPVVAAIGGFALGGGCELALACHLRVASEKAKLGLPEVGLGIIPGYGGTRRLARLVGLGRALELTLTGAHIDARRAYEIGLVNQVYAPESFLSEARAFLEGIVKNGPVALRMALESVYHGLDVDEDDALAFESSLFGLLASTEDMKEGMGAFLEKRKPAFKGR